VSLGSDALLSGVDVPFERGEFSRSLLWSLAVLVYGVGDLASTLAGIRLGASEGNPVPAALIDAAPGLLEAAALLTLWKAVIILAFAAFAWRLPSRYAVAVPVGLCLVGTAVVGWNASVILSVAS
jgi:hypothetical protein